LVGKNNFFSEDAEVIQVILGSLDVRFYTPEVEFIKQFDEDNKDLYFMGDGIGNIFIKADSRDKEFICQFKKGSMLNEVAATFNFRP